MPAAAETERAVHDVLERFSEANRARDPDAAIALFADDPDICVIGSLEGEIWRGRDEIHRFFRRVMQRPGAYSWRWLRRDVATRGDIAWFAAETIASVVSADAVREGPYRITAVLERRNGDWKLLLFHGARPITSDPADLGSPSARA